MCVFQRNGNQKKGRVAIFISTRIDFKLKMVKRDKRRSLYNDRGVNPPKIRQ